MATIRDLHNPWRDKLKPASFRGASFKVDTDIRRGGRRVVLHQYPKRDDPYAEDLGRSARRFVVQGYLIGPEYLVLRDILIAALEEAGPGTLKLPLAFQSEEVEVMADDYSIVTSKDHGGMCRVDMDFIEAGTPGFGSVLIYTKGIIAEKANALEDAVVAGEGS